MLIDRPQVTETSTIINATVASGTSDPANPDVGELFFRTDLNQLRVYSGSAWAEVGSTGLAGHEANGALHLTADQNTLLDGIVSTLTATEVNYLDGVTSSIQTQLNSKLNHNGTNAATGNLNIGGFKLTNVGTPTANTDATNLLYVEQQISTSVPVGVRGQVPFIATDNTRTSVQSFTATTGQFVESDAELALAQTRIVSGATIFNEWFRFSHSAGIGLNLTRTAGVSNAQFLSGNSATLLASFPVGSTVQISCPTNTTFNGTWTITASGIAGTAYIRFSQVGQPDVATAASGTLVLDSLQPAISAEITSWSYDSGTDTIQSTVNSDSHIGFISDKRYSSYQLESRVASTATDDDSIGVVIAWAIVGGREHTLTAIRSPGGNNFTWRVVYNYLRSDAVTVYDGTSFVKWGNGGYGANWTAAGYNPNTPGSNWGDHPTGCRIRVTRSGDVFTVETSDLSQTTYLTGGAVATINLTSAAYLNKFRGPTPYGFSAMSQANATFQTLSFTDNQNAIYDIRNGNKYEYVSGAWVLQSGESLTGDLGPGRFLFDRYTEKLYYTDPDLGAIKLVTNVGEDLVPQVEDLQTDLSAHMADDARHLTSAQNALIDAISTGITADEINQLDGISTAQTIQTQLNARLRLNGLDTMTGNLQMGGQRITNLGAPTASTDAATKDYVDTYVQGMAWKQSVRVATTTNIILSGLQTINGVTVATNDRVLVKNQTNTAENGIYLASSSAWSRAPDANTPEELDGAAVFVRSGTVDADSAWIQVNAIVTVGTTAVSWSRFAASGGVTEGTGIDITGSVVSVDAGQGLTFSGNTLVTNINTATDFAYSSGQINLSQIAGLTPAVYGSSSAIPVITVNDRGRITAIGTVAPAYQGADNTLSAIAAISDGAFGLIARTSDTASGATVRSIVVNATGATSSNTNGVSGNPTFNLNDTSTNTANRIVSRDAAGNFAASTITASLTGAASDNVLKAGDLMSGNLRFSTNGIGLSWDSLASFYIRADIGSGNPGINFAANDYIDYNRTSDTMTFANGATRLTINPTAIGTPGGFYLSHAAPANSAAWFSTPAYGISQGDNRTHFGYNNAGNVGNYIRGAFTEVNSSLSVSGFASFSSTATFFASPIINAPTPVLIIRDSDNSGTGAGQVGWISLQDSGGVERGWMGFGNSATTELGITNQRGDLTFTAASNLRMRLDGDATLTLYGTSNTAYLDPDVSSYGSFAVGGQAGGYQGIQFAETPNSLTFMIRASDGLGGVYAPGNSTWQWYYDPSISNIRINGSSPVWHSGNLSPSVSVTANSVIQRDASGYSYHNYINQSSGNSEVAATSISQVMVTNGSDNFLRKASIGALADAVADQGSIADGTWQFRSTGTIGANTSPPLQAYSTSGNSSYMAFHRGGQYAINLGLDTDNVFRIGGWSDGAGTYRMQVSTSTTTVPGLTVTGSGFTPATLSNSALAIYGSSTGGVLQLTAPAGPTAAATYNTSSTGSVHSFRLNGTTRFEVSNTGVSAVGEVYASGNMRINNSSPTLTMQDTDNMPAFLHNNSSIFYVLRNATANSTTWDSGPNGRHPMVLDLSTGNVTFSGNVTAFSDIRLKKNIQQIGNAVQKVQTLRGVTFDHLEEGRGTGLIAQELQQVLPEAVSVVRDGNGDEYLTVAYGNTVGLLVEAIKELKAEIEELKSKLSEK